MSAIIIVIILLVLVVILALVGFSMYNGFVKGRNRIQESWRQVDVELNRRYELLPNLVETVRAYAAHHLHRLVLGGGLADDLHVIQGLEQRHHADPEDRVVVDHDHPHRRPGRRVLDDAHGRLTSTKVPRPVSPLSRRRTPPERRPAAASGCASSSPRWSVSWPRPRQPPRLP